MKIFITCPNPTVPHGGIRVALEVCNRLTQWHEVNLHILNGKTPDWFTISEKVNIVSCEKIFDCDCVILTSPHSNHFQKLILPGQKCFIFLQMMEHYFNSDYNWLLSCKEIYQSEFQIISISKWNIDMLHGVFGRKGKTHYVGNGVSEKDFPKYSGPKEPKTVLIEGWEANNPSKDVDRISHTVADRLKREGYKIVVYSGVPLRTNARIPHEIHVKPNLKKLNELYQSATILLKASKYDARSCSPVEAYQKGTVTARAIIKGDDDLINEVNCLRCGYNADDLYNNAKRLLTDSDLRQRLATAGMQLDWSHWISEINDIITASRN